MSTLVKVGERRVKVKPAEMWKPLVELEMDIYLKRACWWPETHTPVLW